VNGVKPVGRGGEAGCSILTLTAEGGETYVKLEVEAWDCIVSRDGNIVGCSGIDNGSS
jgi:hypothetical protein